MKTLLQEYIEKQIVSYHEPSRGGTLKGSSIGFSRIKFEAAVLIALINTKLKDLGEELGVSYGTLRNWRTEKQFKAELDHRCREFGRISFDYAYASGGREESVKQYSDRDKYSERLKNEIAMLVERKFATLRKASDLNLGELVELILEYDRLLGNVGLLIFGPLWKDVPIFQKIKQCRKQALRILMEKGEKEDGPKYVDINSYFFDVTSY